MRTYVRLSCSLVVLLARYVSRRFHVVSSGRKWTAEIHRLATALLHLYYSIIVHGCLPSISMIPMHICAIQPITYSDPPPTHSYYVPSSVCRRRALTTSIHRLLVIATFCCIFCRLVKKPKENAWARI